MSTPIDVSVCSHASLPSSQYENPTPIGCSTAKYVAGVDQLYGL